MILPPQLPWTDAEDSTLRAGWADGLSANAIARALPGRSRNSVTGRAMRLGLPRRPSPIRQYQTQQEARAARDAARAMAADAEYARAIAREARP